MSGEHIEQKIVYTTRLRSLEYRRGYRLVLAARYADVPLSVRVGGIYSHTHMRARARTHTRMHTLELEGEFTYPPGTRTECPAWTSIDLAYPIDTSGFSLPLPRSRRLSGHSQFYERFQDP